MVLLSGSNRRFCTSYLNENSSGTPFFSLLKILFSVLQFMLSDLLSLLLYKVKHNTSVGKLCSTTW